MHIDNDLLKACSKNKRKAQKTLYEKCYLFMLPICMRYHNNDGDARAAYNNAFMKIINNLHKVDFKEVPFIAWAKRIMINTLIDEYRKSKRYNAHFSRHENERELDYFSTGSVNQAETDYNEESILQLLEQLHPDTKRVFLLYVVEGFSHKEIAELMDMSEGTSKWHLSKGRKKLRKLIKAQEKKTLNLVI